MIGFTETWTGEAEAHECDALGHLNMRHYLYKAQQARQMFIMMLGLPSAFTSGHPSSVKFMDAHIQYKAESRPGELLRIETGLLEITDNSMRLLHVIRHLSGAVSASIIEKVEHVYLPTGASFAWPKRVKEAAQSYKVDIPNFAAPRSLDPLIDNKIPTQTELESWGVKAIGRGVFQSREEDMFGRIMGAAVLGRASDCVAHYKGGWPEAHDEKWAKGNVMGILLETHFACLKPMKAGQPFLFYSAIKSVNKRTRNLVHHMIDPFTGLALARMEAVAALFDLDNRKIVSPNEEVLAQLQSSAVPELSA